MAGYEIHSSCFAIAPNLARDTVHLLKEARMGDEYLSDSEKRWNFLARNKGYQCSQCGASIPFWDRVLYFETDLCSYCKYKDDEND